MNGPPKPKPLPGAFWVLVLTVGAMVAFVVGVITLDAILNGHEILAAASTKEAAP